MKIKEIKRRIARAAAMLLSVAVTLSNTPVPVLAQEGESFYIEADSISQNTVTEETEDSEETILTETISAESQEEEINLSAGEENTDIEEIENGKEENETAGNEEENHITEEEELLLAQNALTGCSVVNPSTANGYFIDKKKNYNTIDIEDLRHWQMLSACFDVKRLKVIKTLYEGKEEDYLVTFSGLTKRDGQFIVSRTDIKDFSLNDLKNRDDLNFLYNDVKLHYFAF